MTSTTTNPISAASAPVDAEADPTACKHCDQPVVTDPATGELIDPDGDPDCGPNATTCDECDGSGMVEGDCATCEGTSVVEDADGEDEDCDDCNDGAVDVTCDDCRGDGDFPGKHERADA